MIRRWSSANPSPQPSTWSRPSSWTPRCCPMGRRRAQSPQPNSPTKRVAVHSLTAATWTRRGCRRGMRIRARRLSSINTCGREPVPSPSGSLLISSCTRTWTTIQPPWRLRGSDSLVWTRNASGVPLAFSGSAPYPSIRSYQTSLALSLPSRTPMKPKPVQILQQRQLCRPSQQSMLRPHTRHTRNHQAWTTSCSRLARRGTWTSANHITIWILELEPTLTTTWATVTSGIEQAESITIDVY